MIKPIGLGLIHIYFGQGVGKTTRAVGLAIRAAGAGLEVNFVQFMKSGTSGETRIFAHIPNICYQCPGKHPFIMPKGPDTVHYEHAEKSLGFAFEAVENKAQLLICDEILDTLIFDISKQEQIAELVRRCKGKTELVMTGASAPQELIEMADYVTELRQIKHPYYSGARAREGIEY